jgi:N utilization substance protein A
VHELHGERIDIIPWSDDPATFVCSALAPAEVSEIIVDEESRSMEIIVEDNQLSLAIGKKGQNVRLAANLANWRIDIASKSKYEEKSKKQIEDLMRLEGMDTATAEKLVNADYLSASAVAEAPAEELSEALEVDMETAEKLKESARVAGNAPAPEADSAENNTETAETE